MKTEIYKNSKWSMSASEEPLDLLKTNYGPFCSSHEEFSKKIKKKYFLAPVNISVSQIR